MRLYILKSRRMFRRMDLGVILWPSFLAACGASLLFFAAVDPLMLREAGPHLFAGIDRDSGYAIGFLFFWGVATAASGLSVYLMRTARESTRLSLERDERP